MRLVWRRRRFLSLTCNQRNHRADFDAIGPFRNINRRNHAFVHGFKFHRRLIGFDLGQNIARFDEIAFFNQPFGQGAFFHRW
jgi:hypothetical protein